MMDQAIRDFAKQFEYNPVVENADKLPVKNKFLMLGMGGSHLAGDILQAVDPALDLIVHRDYGLPVGDLSDRLVIASSYSGNTEEIVDGLEQAVTKKLPVATIAVGAKLIERAKKYNLAYIQMPDTGIQPRSALGFSFRGLLKLLGKDQLLQQSAQLATVLKPADQEPAGKALAKKFKGYVPIIYASNRNTTVAWNWKIKLNETGKIPAFYNTFSELNHNEMTGFDVKKSTKKLSANFKFIFLHDADDHPRIQKRMEITARQYHNRGFFVETVAMAGASRLEKIFFTLPLADWFAFYTAEQYGLESEQVPMVEEFKKLIA
jgi:glucose/mannose-6-phosphate isomerase